LTIFPEQEEIMQVISTLYKTIDYFSQIRGDRQVISTLCKTVDYFPKQEEIAHLISTQLIIFSKQEEIAQVISTLCTTVEYFSQTRGDSASDLNAVYNSRVFFPNKRR
jgi:hypothetical protein